MCLVNKYICVSHKYNATAIILIQCKLDNNWYAASSMAATQNNKHRASLIRDAAQVDCAYRIPEDIIRRLAYIFPVVFLLEFENIFPEKSLSETDEKNYTHSFAIGGFMYVNFSIINYY